VADYVLREEETEIEADEVEIVDGLPVTTEQAAVVPSHSPTMAVAQTAAVAVGSFVAGAATAAVLARHLGRSFARPPRRGSRQPAPAEFEVLATRSILIDVHTLGRRGQ
jgi:hypothetical protein